VYRVKKNDSATARAATPASPGSHHPWRSPLGTVHEQENMDIDLVAHGAKPFAKLLKQLR
jgi:hypothetical protein